MRALILTFLLPCFVWAQAPEPTGDSNKGKQTSYVSAFAGRFLPYGIFGVRDTYPYWGILYGHTMPIFDPEYSFTSIMAKGVVFYSGAISIAFTMDFEGIRFIPYVGADVHYYHGRTNLRELEFGTSFGSHIGFAPLIEINKQLYIRTDFKMNFGPGRSLNVGSGLTFYF